MAQGQTHHEEVNARFDEGVERHSEIVAHLSEGTTRHTEVITSIGELGRKIEVGLSSTEYVVTCRKAWQMIQ